MGAPAGESCVKRSGMLHRLAKGCKSRNLVSRRVPVQVSFNVALEETIKRLLGTVPIVLDNF